MSTTPLPAIQGTPHATIDQAFRALQKRLLSYGGQLVDSAENANVLAAHMRANGTDSTKSVYTSKELLDAMWLGVCESFGQLKFNPLPQKLYLTLQQAKAERLQAKEDARRARAEADNANRPFDIVVRINEAQKEKDSQDNKAANEKAHEERERIIHDYSVNSSMPGRIDHRKSEEGRAYLRKLKITGKNGKFSEILTLSAVQALRWCDSVEQMQRALDRWLQEVNETSEERLARQLQIEGSGYVGARGR